MKIDGPDGFKNILKKDKFLIELELRCHAMLNGSEEFSYRRDERIIRALSKWTLYRK